MYYDLKIAEISHNKNVLTTRDSIIISDLLPNSADIYNYSVFDICS